MEQSNTTLWKARKRNLLFFGLPWTFTVYELQPDKLCISSGIFTKKFEEIKLYRIKDFTVRMNLIQRLFKLGTIHVCSADSTSPEFDLINLRDSIKVKDLISDQVENARKESSVSPREIIGHGFDAGSDEI